MSAVRSMRCTQCHNGNLQPARLRIILTYNGQAYAVDDDDALACEACGACGDEMIGERAAAFLLTHRPLAPHAEMSVTVSRRAEIV
jgi:hypothetical protein